MTRRTQKRLIKLVVALLIFVLGGLSTQNPNINQHLPLAAGVYSVTQFDDGDTIVVDMNGKQEKVRFIGVDTPETHDPRKPVQCFGREAAAFTADLIGNQNVRLEADPTNTNRDRYGRLLRYVYLPDNRLVNAEIIKQGYGFAYLGFPAQKASEFQAYEDSARQQKLGLWAGCQPFKNDNGGYSSPPVTLHP